MNDEIINLLTIPRLNIYGNCRWYTASDPLVDKQNFTVPLVDTYQKPYPLKLSGNANTTNITT